MKSHLMFAVREEVEVLKEQIQIQLQAEQREHQKIQKEMYMMQTIK